MKRNVHNLDLQTCIRCDRKYGKPFTGLENPVRYDSPEALCYECQTTEMARAAGSPVPGDDPMVCTDAGGAVLNTVYTGTFIHCIAEDYGPVASPGMWCWIVTRPGYLALAADDEEEAVRMLAEWIPF